MSSTLTSHARMSAPAAALALSLCALTSPAHAEAPPIKPGLWEITMENHTIDGKPVPDVSAQMAEQLKKLPPEMRQQMEAQMKARGVQMGTSGGRGAIRTCMTKEMVDQNRWQRHDGQCENVSMNRAGNTWSWKFKCTQPPSEGEGTTTFQGSEGYVTEMRVNTQRQGKPHQMTMKHRAKWMGADCGDLKAITPPAPKARP